MTLTKRTITGAAIIALIGTVAAAEGRKMGFSKMDANGDGQITQSEVITAATARFTAADTDQSGTLTLAEMSATGKKRKAGTRKTAEKFARLDTDGDGALTSAEFLASPRVAGLFDRLDKDKNGVITQAEAKRMRSRDFAAQTN